MVAFSSTLNSLIKRASVRFGGDKAKELERFLKFTVVGAIGFVVDFGTLNILQATILRPSPDSALPVVLATSIAFTAAITSNFIWNRYWTYPDSRSRPVLQQLVQFFTVNIAGWLVRSLIVVLLYGLLGQVAAGVINSLSPGAVASPEMQDRIGTNLAQAVAVLAVMFWNFFVNRYWTYNDVS
ncbi:MAG: GtrA family protein [Anaerolineae bacterium]|nr:GtrA family protein [Anaerolineae bacterium]